MPEKEKSHRSSIKNQKEYVELSLVAKFLIYAQLCVEKNVVEVKPCSTGMTLKRLELFWRNERFGYLMFIRDPHIAQLLCIV